ncbi:tetratricopeptide repeat protein [Verrucomicrobia bacterium]|nr:tetratricopeptide repeat protein [Verrucomicrobiota bacterium]
MTSLSTNTHALLHLISGAFLALMVLLPSFTISAQNKAAEAAYEGAAGLVQLQLWDKAAKGYLEYFQKFPKHEMAGHAHHGLGLCHFNLKDYTAAAAELKAAANSRGRSRPNPVEVNLLLGQALMKKEPADFGDAEEAFEASLKSLGFSKSGIINRSWDEQNVKKWLGKTKDTARKRVAADAFLGLLEATYFKGDWKSVLEKALAFEALIKKTSAEQRVRVFTGEAFERTGNFKAAAEAYAFGAKLEGNDASSALFSLGMVRLNQLKDYMGAAKDFHSFTIKYRNDVKRSDAAFNEALCYFQSYFTGKDDHLIEAVDRFKAFAKTNPKNRLADTAQFYAGKLQHSQKQWKAALASLEPILGNTEPALSQLVFLVADSHHRLENWSKAAKFYMQFAKGNETALNADVALHNAGMAFTVLDRPDFDKAIAAYELLEQKCPRSPTLPSARLKLGIIHFNAGRFEKAQGPLNKIPEKHPLRADADYFLAWTDLDNQNPAGAAKRFGQLGDRLKKSAPEHRLIPLAKLYQGIAEFERGRFGNAEETLTQFVADYSEHKMFYEAAFNLGQAQMELRKWGDAIKSYKKVPDDSPLHHRALYQSGRSKRFDGKDVEAIPFYNEFLEYYANNPMANDVAFELAELEFEKGGQNGGADSVKRLTALLSKKPNAVLRQKTLFKLGIVQFSEGNYEASAMAFEEMLNGPPVGLAIDAAWQAGEARRLVAASQKGDAKDKENRAALKNYNLALNAEAPAKSNPARLQELARFQQQALLRVGETEARLEQWQAAQKSYEQFIKVNPKHILIRTAFQGLGWAMQNQEKYPVAIEFLEKAVAAGTRDDVGARAQFLLGECYLEQENYDKAIIEFSKVESLYAFPAWQSKAAYEMAQSLLRQDNRDGARRQFERLVKSYPDTPAATAAKSALKRLN